MALSDVIFKRGRPSSGLGGFDEEEAASLPLHVRNCARRYDDLRAAMDRLQILIWITILLILAGNTVSLRDVAAYFLK